MLRNGCCAGAVFYFGISFVFLSTVFNLAGADQPKKVISVTPTRAIVKVRPAFAQKLERTFSTTTMEVPLNHADVRGFAAKHGLTKLAPMNPGRFALKLETGLNESQQVADVRNNFPRRSARNPIAQNPPELLRTYVAEFGRVDRVKLEQIVQQLGADPDVEYAQVDHVVHIEWIPNDPFLTSTGTWSQAYPDLYGLWKIEAPAAWDSATGTAIVVAVIDTGIDYRHPEITNRLWINTRDRVGNNKDDDRNGYKDDIRGWDFINNDNDPSDGHGHGTHVAGTIAAEGNNGVGVIGIAWEAKIMALKGLDDNGYGDESALANAIHYAADNGADIINASWGGPGSSQVIADAISYAYNLGVIFVAAAGNDNNDVANFYPANHPNVITVSAFDASDAKAYFSNFGQKIDVAAPGVDILSLHAAGTYLGQILDSDTNYTRASGTSMATPHVAGTAALVLSKNPDYTVEEIRQVLRSSADDVWNPGFDLQSGYGRINARKAVGVTNVLQTKILSPSTAAAIAAPVSIQGVARGTNFDHYTLEYGAGNLPAIWQIITQTNMPVSGGNLGVLDPSFLPDGAYALRLRAYTHAGEVFEDRSSVIVDYVSIDSPAAPRNPNVPAVYKPGVVLPIMGKALGAAFQGFRVRYARGLNASNGWSEANIQLVNSGAARVTNGLLAQWDTSAITEADYYTLNLEVRNQGFTNIEQTYVYLEPDLISTNWPFWLPQAPDNGNIIAARNASGSNDLVVLVPEYSNGSYPPSLYRFSPDGTRRTNIVLDGWNYDWPAVVDWDGTPGDEIVAGETYDVRIYHSDNSSILFQPTDQVVFAYSFVSVHDLDGDGIPEVLALGARPVTNHQALLYAWKQDGTQFSPSFPITLVDSNFWLFRLSAKNVYLAYDLDGDGKKEIIVAEGATDSSFRLRAFRYDGTPLPWPDWTFPDQPGFLFGADLDHDGKGEVLLSFIVSNKTQILALQADGQPKPGWPVTLNIAAYASAAIGDLDGDGKDEIVVSASGLYVFNSAGQPFSSAWPKPNIYVGQPVLCDVTGDGLPEILAIHGDIVTSPDYDFSKSYSSSELVAYSRDGVKVRGWRLFGANGNQTEVYGSSPVLGDFNGDGKLDIAINYQLVSGGGLSGSLVEGAMTVFSLPVPYRRSAAPWPMWFHDPQQMAARVPANLRIKEENNQIAVSWPAPAGAFQLESTTNAQSGPWNPTVPPPDITNNFYRTTFAPTNGQQFFRLH